MIQYVDTSQELTCLSLCTGIRGLDRGVERVTGPLRTIAFVEVEAALIENLVVGMEAGKLAPAPVWANIKTFPWRSFHGKIFFLIGGYPCQPFSSAGKRKGKDDPRHLWPHIERGIRTVRPVCCFFENVYGHLSLGFDQVAESLRAMGYAVEAGVYTASEVGAPHKRARVFILGILADAKHPKRGTFDRWINGIDPWESTLHGDGKEDTGRFAERGEEVADSPSIRKRSGRCESGEDGAGGEFLVRTEPGCDIIDGRESEMADSVGPGLEEWGEQPTRQECPPVERSGNQERNELDHTPGLRQQSERDHRKPAEAADAGFILSSADRWPAGPGQPQYDWEPPRTIEPRLGCYVDGYNFREDLLRALGNGVVEQTAELAFRDLLRKHFE